VSSGAHAVIRLPRADLELLTSAATAHVALQRIADQQRIAVPDVTAVIDGHEMLISAGAMRANLDALEAAMVRTRRLLGWRR
jgi:hypothetical protein